MNAFLFRNLSDNDTKGSPMVRGQRAVHFFIWTISLLIGTVVVTNSYAEESPQIVLTSPKNLENCQVAVQGLPVALQKHVAAWKANSPLWRKLFSLYVGQEPKPDQPAVLGAFNSTADGFAFTPRFGLEPGTTYSAKLSLPGSTPQVQIFKIPAIQPDEPTRITAVYPTDDKLPENLLRLYLHFSAPMSQGDSYRHLHLFDQTLGEEVQNPFLELPQELWAPDGKRLTVLLDPGRVKQGLKPREQSGPVLIPGHKYTLTIDANWKDATGHPLAKLFKRHFTTIKADILQPDPKKWKFQPPPAGTRKPFLVTFDEPLDHGMLQRVLTVQNSSGDDVAGQLEIDRKETRWKFTPESPWKSNEYTLKIRTHLEDRVGNSIARPFEVDLNEPPPKSVPKVLTRRFRITKSSLSPTS